MFFSSTKIEFLSSRETFGALLSLLLFSTLILPSTSFLSFQLHLFIRGWTQGLLKIFLEKTKLQSFFGWVEHGYTMNMKWESCGYISGGRIFQDGVMHANNFGWG
jgi:hypothetical protein